MSSAVLMKRGAAAFPHDFAEKGKKTDLAGFQFWHGICI